MKLRVRISDLWGKIPLETYLKYYYGLKHPKMTNPEGGLGCHFFFHSLPKNAFLFPEIPFYFPQLQFHFHNCPSTFWKCPFVSRNCIFVFQKILFIFQKCPIFFFFRKLALAFRMSI